MLTPWLFLVNKLDLNDIQNTTLPKLFSPLQLVSPPINGVTRTHARLQKMVKIKQIKGNVKINSDVIGYELTQHLQHSEPI